ncbi:MAG: hypothetical protein WCJ21_09235 [Planctomycetota bacterium]
MKRVFLNVTYRHGRPIAAYFHLPRQPGDTAVQTDRIDDVLLVDRAADGRPIGVEITDPALFDPDRFFVLLESLGQTAVDRDELRPLVAA